MNTRASDPLIRYGKPVVFALCLMPLAMLIYRGTTGDVGSNPVEALTHTTGDWALRLLLVTLAVTPLRRLTGRGWLLRFRRMLGLFAFFYASLHLLTYLWLDQFFDLRAIAEDVTERPYIALGLGAYLLMVPLALTSTRSMVRRLGRRWQVLHRAVYPLAILAVLHFFWLVKADMTEPAVYAAVLGVLLAARLPVGRLRGLVRGGEGNPASEHGGP